MPENSYILLQLLYFELGRLIKNANCENIVQFIENVYLHSTTHQFWYSNAIIKKIVNIRFKMVWL